MSEYIQTWGALVSCDGHLVQSNPKGGSSRMSCVPRAMHLFASTMCTSAQPWCHASVSRESAIVRVLLAGHEDTT